MLGTQELFDREQVEESLSPEYRLMLAVLEDALVTFQYGLRSFNPLRRRRGCEVESWVASTESDAVFSFENICSTLHLDADCIRAGMLQMKCRVHDEKNQEKAGRKRIRLRRSNAEGLHVPRGTIADGTNESRRREASVQSVIRTCVKQAAAQA